MRGPVAENEIPHVPSPYEGKRLKVRDHLSISAFWFGSNVLWAAFLVILLPKQMSMIGGAKASVLQAQLIWIGALIALVVPLAVGPISDRCLSPLGRRRPFIVAGTIVNLAGLAIVFFAGQALSFQLYLVGFLVMQLGNNIATGAYPGLIPDLVPENQRGIASGFMAFMTQLGTAVGAVTAGLLAANEQFALAFLIVGVCLALSAAVTRFAVQEARLISRAPFSVTSYLRSLFAPLMKKDHRDFAWVWITRALVMLGFYIVQPNLYFYLRDVIRVEDPDKTTVTMILLVLIGATITGLVGGHLSERVGRKPIVYAANGLMAAMAIAFPFCTSYAAALFVAIIFGLGYGAYVSVDWALGTDVLPNKADAGKDMAVWHVAMVLPQSISAPIAGYTLASFGTTRVGDVYHYSHRGFQLIFFVAAFFLALGAILLRNVRGAR